MTNGLTHDEIMIACKNVGIDMNCVACAATFYTGSAPFEKHTCKCTACYIEAEIGTEDDPHPVPQRFHSCKP